MKSTILISSEKELLSTSGDWQSVPEAVDMDSLTYEYKENSNLLINVTDDAGSDDSNGFLDWNKHQYTGNNDYKYDDNDFQVKSFEKAFYVGTERSSLILDRNKSIQSITYNHLNLPVRITLTNGKFIEYKYNAAGQKVHKQVYIGEGEHIFEMIDYLDGFQYAGDILQFFPTPEGYVNATADALDNVPLGYKFNYVYNYTDHLGNIRVSYTKDPQTGKLKIIDETEERGSRTPLSKIKNNGEQNHYYPFGLKHERYLPVERWRFMLDKQNQEKTKLKIALTDEYKYKYNGKEWQDELGLNFYDYGARNYACPVAKLYGNPAIGRWMNIDPLAEQSRRFSPYTYALNNPVYFIDPDGRTAEGNSESSESESKNTATATTGVRLAFGVPLDSVVEGGAAVDFSGEISYSYDINRIDGFIVTKNDNGDPKTGGPKENDKKKSENKNETSLKSKFIQSGSVLVNAYAGFNQFSAGVGLILVPEPTTLTKFGGSYFMADGTVRGLVTIPTLYGIWSEDETLSNLPSNLLGLIGNLFDNMAKKENSNYITGGDAQSAGELIGDFGNSKRNLINTLNKAPTVSKTETLKRGGQTVWYIFQPYYNAIFKKDNE